VLWYETPAVQGGLTVGFFAVFLSACLVWPAVALFRRWRGWPSPPLAPLATPWLAFLVSVLNVGFVVGMAIAVFHADLDYGLPPAVRALLAVPLVSAGLTAILAVCVFLVWRNGSGTRLRRAYLSLIALTSVGFLLFLGFWNLLGYNY
jgi:hypothetical protein